MKKINLLKSLTIAAIGCFAVQSASAQSPRKESIADNIGGTRFVITTPSGVSGVKKVNYANWGAPASPTIFNMPIEKAYDTLGATTLLNGTGAYPSLVGKFALIFRGGGFTFSQKVNACITAGAVGVIIVNNIPGDPVGMAPTPTGSTVGVPVMMISDVDGLAINNAIKTAPSDTVKVTIGTWNTGGTHDLGIMTAFQSLPHALNIPFNQMMGSAGTAEYKQYTGGAVANYGTMNETGVTVTDSVFWTPSSGGAAVYVTDKSYTIPSIAFTDSIQFGFAATSYELVPTSTGKYEHRYSTTYPNTDDFPQDNRAIITQNITDSVYCKGGYDFVNKRPLVSIGIQPAGGATNFLMGNMFHIKNGGYSANRLQFSLSVNNTAAGYPALTSLSTTGIFLYKWVDGTAGAGSLDSFVQSGELTPVGINFKDFTTADSSGSVINLDFKDFADPESNKLVVLENNTTYFAVVEVPNSAFIGMDQSVNFFSRSYGQYKVLGSKPGAGIIDNAVGAWFNDNSDFTTTATNSAIPYPFSASAAIPSNVFNVDSILYDKFNQGPAIALIVSQNKASIGTKVSKSIGPINIYPNPATKGTVSLDVNLTEKSDKVEYRLTDMIGRTLYTEVHNNVLNDKFDINTSSYVSGNYFIMIVTDNGFTVKKLSIQN